MSSATAVKQQSRSLDICVTIKVASLIACEMKRLKKISSVGTLYADGIYYLALCRVFFDYK